MSENLEPCPHNPQPTLAAVAEPLLVIGAGNMGSAILDGALRAGFQPALIAVAEPDESRRSSALARGIATFATAAAGLDWLLSHGPTGRVLLAIKPQTLPAVAQDLAGRAPGCAVISILAGVPIARLAQTFGPGASIVRAMPNLPASVSLGVTALCPGPTAPPADAAFAENLFRSVGAVVHIDESLMDAFTALAGSGPAYLFTLAQAMIDAGTRMGFDPATAAAVVRHTLSGSAALLQHSPRTPAELRAAVTSKGGTTEAACAVLADRQVEPAVIAAIIAARNRGTELGRS